MICPACEKTFSVTDEYVFHDCTAVPAWLQRVRDSIQAEQGEEPARYCSNCGQQFHRESDGRQWHTCPIGIYPTLTKQAGIPELFERPDLPPLGEAETRRLADDLHNLKPEDWNE